MLKAMTFGVRLRLAREQKGLTQEGLGKGLGTRGKDVGKSVVYGWEKDQHFPRADQLALICQALGVDADYLLFGKGGLQTPSAEWPFPKVPLDRIAALPDDDRGYVQRKLMQAIAECEQPPTEGKSGEDVLSRYGIPLYPDGKHAPKKRA